MFKFVSTHIYLFLVLYSVSCCAFIHFQYDRRYRKKYREFSNEMHRQYIELYEKAKESARQEALINLMNIDHQKDFHEDCPYCGRIYEDDLPTL